MDKPEAIVFERIDDIGVCRIVGQYTMSAGIELIRACIAQAYEQRISKLMVVITETSGYEVPSLAMRMAMVREWADAARGFVRPAIVCRREFIDPGKFGITMAANFGMKTEAFDTEDEALGWLQAL